LRNLPPRPAHTIERRRDLYYNPQPSCQIDHSVGVKLSVNLFSASSSSSPKVRLIFYTKIQNLLYGAGLLYQITETATTSSTLTYHYDFRGSTIALTDDNGRVTDRIEYSPYGLTTYRAGTNDTPFLFNGRYGVQTDPNGLLYMRARYYNPLLCRFLNPDPSGFGGGLNQYAYANGDPVSLVDPFGLGAVANMETQDRIDSWLESIGRGPGLGFTAEDLLEGVVDVGLTAATSPVTSLAQDIVAGVWGEDPSGEQVSGGQRTLAAVNIFAAFIPEEALARALAKAPLAYSVAFETQLAPSEFALREEWHFQIANEALQAEREVNPVLAELVPEPTRWGRPPRDWTWQHATIEQGGGRSGIMQLVPRYQHTAGSPWW